MLNSEIDVSGHNRNPDFQSTQTSTSAELLARALEPRAISGFVAGVRKTLIPDSAAGGTDRRDVIGVQEHSVGLGRNSQARKFARVSGELADFNAAEVVAITGVVCVVNNSVSDFVYLRRDVAE